MQRNQNTILPQKETLSTYLRDLSNSREGRRSLSWQLQGAKNNGNE